MREIREKNVRYSSSICEDKKFYWNFLRDIQAQLGGQRGVRPQRLLRRRLSRGNSIEISRRDTRAHANNSLGVALSADNGREKSTPEPLSRELPGISGVGDNGQNDADAIHSEAA